MDPRLLEGGVLAASIGGWFAAYGAALLLTRPRGVRAAPTTPDLGTEPPAVVSLIANGWDLSEDAAESTLLDLAARRLIEFRQPDDDPVHTTIHVLDPHPAGLTAYERGVLDRVAGLAVGGVVPLTALTFRDPKKAAAWEKGLRAEVVADARARGLSRRRFGPATVTALSVLAGLAAVGVALAALHYLHRTRDEDIVQVTLGAGVVTFLVLAGYAARPIGERDTSAGREVAARWLGVRDWLRGHEAFAELPPSAVSVWDRYLGYGAALGTTRVASAVIDLGMGNRRRVWSSYGGTWHRVRVSYPRLWPRYGRPAPPLVFRALLAGAAGYAALRFVPFGLVPGLLLLAYAVYVIVRVIVDAAAPRTLTGQVLWQEVWKSNPGGENSPPKPWLHYLAVDDGTGDRTTAWGLPAELVGCADGDMVTILVRPWSRRVCLMSIVDPTAPAPAEQQA